MDRWGKCVDHGVKWEYRGFRGKGKGQGRKNENEILLECHNQGGSFLVGITLFFFCIWRYNPPT